MVKVKKLDPNEPDPEITEYPVQDTFNTDNMSLIHQSRGGVQRGVRSEDKETRAKKSVL